MYGHTPYSPPIGTHNSHTTPAGSRALPATCLVLDELQFATTTEQWCELGANHIGSHLPYPLNI
jgi:hypothetical protein